MNKNKSSSKVKRGSVGARIEALVKRFGNYPMGIYILQSALEKATQAEVNGYRMPGSFGSKGIGMYDTPGYKSAQDKETACLIRVFGPDKSADILGTAKSFKVACVSSNTNSFGLTGVVLIAEDGEAFEAATYAMGSFAIAKGETVTLRVTCPTVAGTGRYSWASTAGRTFEIPRALPVAPAKVLAEIFAK